MYKNILATLATVSLVGIFVLMIGGAYHMHEMKGMGMHHECDGKKDHVSSEAHKAMEERVTELETALEQIALGTQQTFEESFQGLGNLSFFLEKVVDKNYTPEEKEALIAEYQAELKAQQEAMQKQAEATATDASLPTETTPEEVQ